MPVNLPFSNRLVVLAVENNSLLDTRTVRVGMIALEHKLRVFLKQLLPLYWIETPLFRESLPNNRIGSLPVRRWFRNRNTARLDTAHREAPLDDKWVAAREQEKRNVVRCGVFANLRPALESVFEKLFKWL
jgi:hypothetical protein